MQLILEGIDIDQDLLWWRGNDECGDSSTHNGWWMVRCYDVVLVRRRTGKGENQVGKDKRMKAEKVKTLNIEKKGRKEDN